MASISREDNQIPKQNENMQNTEPNSEAPVPPVDSSSVRVPPPIPPRNALSEPARLHKSGKMFSEDGQEILSSQSGRVMTIGGEIMSNETKIKTVGLKSIISGDAAMPEANQIFALR